MKKLTSSVIALVAAASCYGQGTLLFQNSAATAVSNSVVGGRVVAANFKVQLYYLPWVSDAQVPTTADFDSAAVVATSTLFAAGLFNNGGTPVRVEAITPSGAPGWFQVRAWETAFGADYAAASKVIGALVGTSTPIKVDTGDPTVSPAGTPGQLVASGLKSFSVYPVVPEPTAIALGLLGLGSLLFLRRRK